MLSEARNDTRVREACVGREARVSDDRASGLERQKCDARARMSRTHKR